MDLIVLLVGIAAALAASLFVSYVLTRASGIGRVLEADLGGMVAGRVQPGTTFQATSTSLSLKAYKAPRLWC